MDSSLKNAAILGVFWSAIESFSVRISQFVINIFLARLLIPSDYGMIGMLSVFLQISQLFIDGGFGNALIQNKNRTEIDFSTVFYFNLIVSSLIYLLLFFCAPYIAAFYYLPELSLVLRVVSLNLILSSFFTIQKLKLTINIDFRSQLKVTLISVILSGIVSVIMAYNGFGVWALVVQSLMNNLLLTVLFCFILRWKPLNKFSIKSFYSLFSFGSNILFSNLINTIYCNLYPIIIGKYYSATSLGYFTNAERLASLPTGLDSIISRVLFPVMCRIQDDDCLLNQSYRKQIRVISFLIFPVMFALIALAYPMVNVLLTEKWIQIVPLFQIICLAFMFNHISSINLTILYVKGRSDLSFRLEIIKKTIAIIILFSSIPFGLIAMCWGRVLYYIIASYINTYYTKKIIGLSFVIQLKDIVPYFITAFIMAVIVYFEVLNFNENIIKLFVGIPSCIVIYFILSYLFCRDLIVELRKMILNYK